MDKLLTAESRERDDLRALFGHAIAVFASLTGPDHVVETASPAFFATVGTERTGVPLNDLLPETADHGFVARLDGVYRTGEAYTGRDVRVMLGTGPDAREAYFDFTYEPRRGPTARSPVSG